MRAILAALSSALLAACAPQPPDARELLREMQSALIENEGFSYRFELSDLKNDEGVRTTLLGSATILRLDLSGGLYLARMEATAFREGQPRSFVGVKTRDDVYIADATKRVSYQASMYSAGSQLVARMEPGFMYVFYDPRSLAEEIDALVSWEGTLEIGGARCELVRVEYQDDPEDSRWCIGRVDKLPRRLEWIEDGSGTRLDLFEVELAGALAPEHFSFEAPEGYQIEIREAGPGRGTPIPELTLELAGGDEIALQELAGDVLVFDFWATWCAPCRASLRSLERTASAFAGQPVRFFAVNALEDLEPGDPLAFVEENGFTTEIVLSGDQLHAFFAAGNLPALAVVDAQGRSFGVTIGFHGEASERHVRRLIRGALEASATAR